MVQIPEYTRRENAQPIQRGGINLSIPGALTGNGPGEVAGKKALKLSGELADVFVNMKERRDEGIVSAFMNQYDKDSTQKLLQLKEQYRGSEAEKIMPEFQKWRDDYIAEHSSYNPDSAKEGVIYLEDAAQNRIAKRKLDSANVRDINSISSYIATEEETFRVNNLETSKSNNSVKIIASNNLKNIASLKEAIAGDVGSLYKGQSKQYIDAATNDVLDTAIYGNIMRDSAINPIASITRFQDKNLTAEMSTQMKEKAYEQLLKSFVDYQAQQLSNAQLGKHSSAAGDEFYKRNESFFKGNLEAVRSEIDDKATKLYYAALEKDEKERVSVLRNLTVQLLSAQERGDTAKVAETLTAMTGVRGGVEEAQKIADVDTEVNSYEYWIKEANDPEAILHDFAKFRVTAFKDLDIEQAKRSREKLQPVLNKINHDEYNTINDIKDFDSLMPLDKKKVLTAFSNRARYNSLIENAKSGSKVDFSGHIKEIYKNERGDPTKNPAEYNLFSFEMAEKITNYLALNPNKIPTPKELQDFANTSLVPDNKSVYSQMVEAIEKTRNTYKKGQRRDYHTNIAVLEEEFKNISNKFYHNATERNAVHRASEFALSGQLDEAFDILKEAGLVDTRSLYDKGDKEKKGE